MNANELADKLEKLIEGQPIHDDQLNEAATMLRQQQAEIEALKNKTLTEDEIREVADSICHAWKKNGVGELYMEDFARAILRKAQEK